MHRFSFKLAFRALARNKVYSLLNVLGLALGFSVSLIIFLFLQSELTYDRYTPNHQEIYRLHCEFEINGQREGYAEVGHAMGPFLAEEFDFIESATRLIHIDESVLFQKEDIQIGEENLALADSNFFKVFEYHFLEGNPDKALVNPRSIVITESFAAKYFGTQNPIGKIISTNNYDYTVTGLIADLPSNIHHNFSAIISSFFREFTADEMIASLWRVDAHTFLRLDRSYESELLLSRFDDFYAKYMMGNGGDIGAAYSLDLMPLEDIHFGAKNLKFDRPIGSSGYMYAFAAIGLLILILASINYINMATIRSLKRVKEAGMQKVLGSSKRQIMSQVLMESLLLSSVALLFALVIVELVLELTPLNLILGKTLGLNFLEQPNLWWFPIVLTVCISLLSGWYPAVYLSRVPALAAIKKGLVRKDKGLGVRKFLVGFQFTISVAVVITALLMYRQMEFVKNKDLGFNKEDIVLVPIQDTLTASRMNDIQGELAKSTFIKASTTASAIPGKTVDRTLIRLKDGNDEVKQQVVDFMMVGMDYFKTMEIELSSGRTFLPEDLKREDYPIILNEAAAKLFKRGDQVLNSDLEILAPGIEENFKGHVVGIAKDFNAHSLRQNIEPLIINIQEEAIGYLHVRVDSENLLASLTDIESTLANVRPDIPFQFTFLNKDLLELYEEEQRQSRLILFLTYLAILISFIGLTGLASFTTSLRTREVGIRKVLGAELPQMISLIFKEMLTLIIVSIALALPLAYFLIQGWLSNFAYKADLNPLIFIFSGLVAVILAYIIISYHSYKIAKTKPVNTLRYE